MFQSHWKILWQVGFLHPNLERGSLAKICFPERQVQHTISRVGFWVVSFQEKALPQKMICFIIFSFCSSQVPLQIMPDISVEIRCQLLCWVQSVTGFFLTFGTEILVFLYVFFSDKS